MLHGYFKYREGDRLRLDAPRRTSNINQQVYQDQIEELPVFGYYTVLEVDEQPGIFHAVSHGNYRLQCACGSGPVVKHISTINAELHRRSRLIYSCGCRDAEWRTLYAKPLGRPPGLLEGTRTRIEPGQVFGRLLISAWVPGKGWLCYCEDCGGEEYVRYSSFLARVGNRMCEEIGEMVNRPEYRVLP